MHTTYKLEFDGTTASKKSSCTYNIIYFLTSQADKYNQNFGSKNDKGEFIVRGNIRDGKAYTVIAQSPNSKNNLDLSSLDNDHKASINIYFISDSEESEQVEGSVRQLLTNASNIEDGAGPHNAEYYDKFALQCLENFSKTIINIPNNTTVNIHDLSNAPIGVNGSNAKKSNIKLFAIDDGMKDAKLNAAKCLDEALVMTGDSLEKELFDKIKLTSDDLKTSNKGVVIQDTRLYSFYTNCSAKHTSGIQVQSGKVPMILINNNNFNPDVYNPQGNDLRFAINNQGIKFKFDRKYTPSEDNAVKITEKLQKSHADKKSSPINISLSNLCRLAVLHQEGKETLYQSPYIESNDLKELYNSSFAGDNLGTEKLNIRPSFKRDDDNKSIAAISYEPSKLQRSQVKLNIVRKTALDSSIYQVRGMLERFR